MSTIFTDFMFWGFLALANLAISVLIFNSTRLERKLKVVAESTISTKPIYTGPSLPSSFTYLSLATGILNIGGAYLRLRRIHFLDFPTIPWVYEAFREWTSPSSADGAAAVGDELKKLLEAQWIVAMNDWMSLALALTFFVAACLNFATVRQLVLRDRWKRETLLPMKSPAAMSPLTGGVRGTFVNGENLAERPVQVAQSARAMYTHTRACSKRGSISFFQR
jgi:hypothetical protein